MNPQRTIVIPAAIAGAVLMLGPSAYFNIAPNMESAASDASMRGMVAVQIACVIFLAIMPFVRHRFSRFGHTALTVALVIFNAMVAFQTANHRHDTDTGPKETTIFQGKAIDAKLAELRKQRGDLGTFWPASKEQADAIQRELDEAGRDKRNCWKHCEAQEKAVTDTQARLNETLARVTKTETAAKLDKQIEDMEAKRLALGYVPKHADQSSARLASLIPFASEEDVAKGWMLFQAFMIEILNRFAPATMFFFIMGLASDEGEGRTVVEHKPAPVPSIALPAVPHLPVEAAPMIEADASAAPRIDILSSPLSEQPPAPLPPSGRRRTKARKQGSKPIEPRGDNIIPFAKKPTLSDIQALMASGKTQKEIAALFECSDRTIRNILSVNRKAESAVSLQA